MPTPGLACLTLKESWAAAQVRPNPGQSKPMPASQQCLSMPRLPACRAIATVRRASCALPLSRSERLMSTCYAWKERQQKPATLSSD